MLKCWEIRGKPDSISYEVPDFKDNIVIWRKYSHFKKGDFYRVKRSNGSISEVEIEDITDNGCINIIEYSAFKWREGEIIHKKGAHTHSVTSSSIWADTMFRDIQERGAKFHKIKKLSRKYKLIKTHWDIKW